MKKNTKITFSRSFSILAAAALSMTLIGGQTFPAYAENSSGIESGAVIPDNITIDSPTALANIALHLMRMELFPGQIVLMFRTNVCNPVG